MKWLRFAELKARGIVDSWPMIARRVERDGFPPGRMLGPNTRAWSESEIEQWLNSRPVAGQAGRPAALGNKRRGVARIKHEAQPVAHPE